MRDIDALARTLHERVEYAMTTATDPFARRENVHSAIDLALEEAALRAGGSLDEAWAEAEAALPEGWKIERLDLGVWGSWWAYAGRGPERVHGEGDTPAEALSALAAALRGPQATDRRSATSSKTSTDLREGKP